MLNSTLVGLFKTFYGRFAGTEGNLKTEVVDVNLLEVPDPRTIDAELSKRLTTAIRSMSRRTVGRLVEEQLMQRGLSPRRARRIAAGPLLLSDELRRDDRRQLDDAAFELLGVSDAAERAQLVQRLHEATALHFRRIRVVELEKQQQRARTANRRFSVQELAADAWDAAELPDLTPLAEWVGKQLGCDSSLNIPEERPAEMSPSPMFDPNTVYFGKAKSGGKHAANMDCASNAQGKLIVRLANVGIEGWVNVPDDEPACLTLLRALNARLHAARKRFDELAESRTSDPRLQAQIVEQVTRWFVRGRHLESTQTDAGSDAVENDDESP